MALSSTGSVQTGPAMLLNLSIARTLLLVTGNVLFGVSLAALDETHARLQAVDAQGVSTWAGTMPFRVTGVILNNAEDFLDPAPGFVPWDGGAGIGQMGGQWQVFVQSVDPSDRGGTACWVGQNYGNLPFKRDSAFSYTDEEWLGELSRIERDPSHRHRFRKGDLVRIIARRSLFYAGKQNINEAHDKMPEADFAVELIEADRGFPAPEPITLEDVVRPDDDDPATHEDIFDPTRATGGERYQAMRVRLEGIQLVDASGWNSEAPYEQRLCRVTDGQGRFFPMRLPRYSLGPPPARTFDVIGVFDQNSGSGTDGTHGYELFAQEIVPRDGLQLEIARKTVIDWQATGGDYELEGTDDLEGGVWSKVDAPLVMMGDRWTAIVDASAARRFYRLRSVEP
jgi:hypothetical protein